MWASQTSITAWNLNEKQLWQIPYAGKPITQVMSVEKGAFFLFLAQDGTMTAFDPMLICMINQDIGNITVFDFNGKTLWSLDDPSSVNEVIIE